MGSHTHTPALININLLQYGKFHLAKQIHLTLSHFANVYKNDLWVDAGSLYCEQSILVLETNKERIANNSD